MNGSSKKVVVYAVAVFGIAVLVASGFALKRPILEQWYIWQLESEEEQSRYDAAVKLSKMGVVGAVPGILKTLGRASEWKYPISSGLPPREMLFFYLWKLTSVAGKRSVPCLVTALDDEGWYVARSAALLLGSIGSNARGAIPALTTALRHESESVRDAAADALKKIQGVSLTDDQQR